jgi:metabotropic X receptor
LFSGLSGDNFRFDSNGDGPARYNIIHYKQVKPGQYQWVNVGYFQDDKIQLNMKGEKTFQRFLFLVHLLTETCAKKQS